MDIHPRFCKSCVNASLQSHAANRPYFKSTELSTIYNFPSPGPNAITVAVISFGGGLVGTVSPSGVLTEGDVQQHWAYLGISAANFPKVIIVPVNGATNQPNPTDGATIENTIDVETIGAMCPTSNLTIILYLAPNSFVDFKNVIAKVSTTTVINGIPYTPSIVSCSWGASELYWPASLLATINGQLQALAQRGIVFTAATGDYGSSNGGPGVNVDFPSSSPHTLACGGTTLVCPNNVYDSSTNEVGWTGGGGGVSAIFPKPAFQSTIPTTRNGRSTPDIALVADPNTGVVYTIGGSLQVIGGTSIVSPAMAAYTAALNLNKVITPILYTSPANNFHDVINGSNGAYSAKAAYDNCTGFGSIHGINLANTLYGGNTGIPVTGVTLSTTALQLNTGSSSILLATVAPSNATTQTVLWTSSSPGVATVSSSGQVTAVRGGMATITAMTADRGITATCVVTVNVPVVPVTSITVSPSAMTLSVKQQKTITATTKTVTWSSSNPSVATVIATSPASRIRPRTVSTTDSATITGVAPGTATITATSGSVSSTSVITVLPVINNLTLIPSFLFVPIGATSQTAVVFNPSQSAVPVTTWTSSNQRVASVSATGLVKALRTGTTTITVSVNGKFASRVVIVR